MTKKENDKLRAIHVWIRRRKPSVRFCEDCVKEKKLEIANISQEYKRDINDWEWLCRRCHMIKDGRIGNGVLSSNVIADNKVADILRKTREMQRIRRERERQRKPIKYIFCQNCGKKEVMNGMGQKFCGSRKLKIGCAYNCHLIEGRRRGKKLYEAKKEALQVL